MKAFKFEVLAFACTLMAAMIRATPVGDAMSAPMLRDVRLLGVPAVKMNDLFRNRVTGEFARLEVYGEARRAFIERDDDVLGHGGMWRGEFWGKLMLGSARVADYLDDSEYKKWIREECHRVMALQDADGYLGSYSDKGLVSITDSEKTRSIYGWEPVWNIWNRKYVMWGMLMAYKVTGDHSILASVKRQMDQLIDLLHRRHLKLHDTGTPEFCGLPSMSILKPLLMLYEETNEKRYLDFATEMLLDWDREDGECPGIFRNAKKRPLYAWYEKPESWAKTYEFLSCMDGLVEYYRVTGDRRCLETATVIRDNLYRSDLNVFGSVGFGDKMIGAPRYCSALNEVCDVIHWIRFNIDLFLVTGEKHYLDVVEIAYFNGYLAGIFRGGVGGPFFLRGQGRCDGGRGSCGYAYNHCCVNNLPRTFMDIASIVVTRDRTGVFHVNFYQDATVSLDGVKFEISGNYPVDNVVTIKVGNPNVKVEFRKPDWCPKMDVMRMGGGRESLDACYQLTFDMNTRVIDRLSTVPALNKRDDKSWAFGRYRNYHCPHVNTDLRKLFRVTPAAYVMHGPLVLSKSRLIGDTRMEVFAETDVNGKGYAAKVTSLPGDGRAWGLWQLELTKSNEPPIRIRVCDFQSSCDVPCSEGGDLFSIWF